MTNRRKRILIVGDTARSLISFRGKLVQQLSKQHQVYVLVPKIHDHDFVRQLKDWGVGIYESNLDGSNLSVASDIRFISQLAWLILKLKPDVFFPYTLKPVIYGSIVSRVFRVGTIMPMITGLGYTFSDSGKRGGVKAIVRKLLRISLAGKRTRLICQNHDDVATLRRHAVIPDSQEAHVVSGSGVDLTHYEPSDVDQQNISFLMISRLINAKGVLEFYEAARIVKEQHPTVSFKLAGDQSKNIDSIDDVLLQKLKAGTVVNYLGDVEDIRNTIHSSSVVVLPSYYGEGIPRCLLEAMAMKRPIITTNSVGCKETVNLQDKQNGFLVEPRNIEMLAAKIKAYIEHPSLIAEHADNGLYWAKNKFNVEAVNSHIESIMLL